MLGNDLSNVHENLHYDSHRESFDHHAYDQRGRQETYQFLLHCKNRVLIATRLQSSSCSKFQRYFHIQVPTYSVFELSN